MTESSINPHLYALIAGELSGDTLGAGLMKAILRHDPQAQFIGIGGPKMCKCGLNSAFKMEELSVMGIFEVIKHLRPILKIRKDITNLLLQARPCVMIGIDSPDFNLSVEAKLKAAGIKTIHYVSPSVWAWREGRMKKIRAACDEILALLPFEKEFYDKEGMPCTYVGHSLANSIPLEINQKAARERIALSKNCVDGLGSQVLAILPGSRRGIITRMLPIYALTSRILKAQLPDLTFIAVAPNRDKALLIKDLWLQEVPELSLTVFVGNGQDVIASADVCLLTSGTVAFEAMLLKRPMVVAYKVSALSAAIARRLLKVSMFSLPNLLAKREIVKEFIQENCTPFNLATECARLLSSDNAQLKNEFTKIHQQIRTNSDELSAQVVMRLAQEAIAGAQSQLQSEVKGQAISQASPQDSSQVTTIATTQADSLASDDSETTEPSDTTDPVANSNLAQVSTKATLDDTVESNEFSEGAVDAALNEAKDESSSANTSDEAGNTTVGGALDSKSTASTQDAVEAKDAAKSDSTSETESMSDSNSDSKSDSKDESSAMSKGEAKDYALSESASNIDATAVSGASAVSSTKDSLSSESSNDLSGEELVSYSYDAQGYRSFVDQTQDADPEHDAKLDFSNMRTDVQDLAQGIQADSKTK